HGTGYLVAAAACRALSGRRESARLSLARTATLLVQLGLDGDRAMPAFGKPDFLLPAETEWGPVRQVPAAGRIDGFEVKWRTRAGPLGRHTPRWD
ncbi:MAG: acyl-CoA transferase, partial [Betaproteobacteria bacterium]|nr:acyl-CoA transferase [Betaproteobacteria bacterium]